MQSTIFDNVTDHAAVKAILSALNLHNWKHVCYWSKLFGNGIKNINIIHCSGKQNLNSDWQPVLPASPTNGLNEEVQIAMISCQPAEGIRLATIMITLSSSRTSKCNQLSCT